jgi:hypothetical protein
MMSGMAREADTVVCILVEKGYFGLETRVIILANLQMLTDFHGDDFHEDSSP